MRHVLLFMVPINKLISNMKLTKKFVLIILVCILGYLPGGYFIYTTLNSAKLTTNDEIDGVNYFESVFASYSTLMDAYSGANTQNTGRLTAIVQNEFDNIKLLNKDTQNTFQSDDEYQAIETALISASKITNPQEYQQALLPVIQQFKDLFDKIVSKSSLALDPDFDSYYIMDLSTIKLPLLQTDYALFAQNTSINPLLPAEQYKIDRLILANRIQDTIADITKSLKKIAGNNPSLKAYSDKTISSLSKVSETVKTDVTAITKGAKTETDGIAMQMTIHSSTLEGLSNLKKLLMQRLNTISTSFWGTWSLVFLCFTLMLYFVAGFISSIRYSINALIESIRLISAGNLATDIPKIGRDELTDVMEDMSKMQSGLLTMVGDISDVSGTLNCSAHEISSGNNDLSERTQEQASCLVETSASLNNLTQTIKKNAANANEASDLAGTATNFAQKGGEAVNQAITTMGDINESAKKIQEITGVIDGIAFQTNLLALNASVEAARAGEQGRGFAVVASEVRNLAQRSAEAAKQIKGLINDSMNKVASGDAQVKVTWTTMQDIVTSIEHVNSIVAKISTASNEQSLSIEQINIVISQLEGNTQKNAAQVEEVAASAELLKEQSNKLVDIVGEFEIKQTSKVKAKPKQTSLRDSYSPAPQTTQSTPDLDSAWEEF